MLMVLTRVIKMLSVNSSLLKKKRGVVHLKNGF